MPANQFVDLAAAVNFRAESVSIELAGTYCGPYAYATCFRPTGPRPGYAQITIPHAPSQVARKARSMALNPDGLAGKAIIGPEIVVKRRVSAGDSPVSDAFCVCNLAVPDHDVTKDNLLLMGLDKRWKLMDVRVEGSFVINPKFAAGTASYGEPEYYYVEGQPPIFNFQGRANGYRLSNGIKVFTPWPDFGLKGDQVPGMEGVPLEYFFLQDILDYLWYFHGPSAPIDALIPYFPHLKKCPSDIRWPQGMGGVVAEYYQANFNQGLGQGTQKMGGSRKGREVNMDGVAILDGIEQMLKTAGGYTLAISDDVDDTEGTGDAKGITTLSIVPARFLANADDAHVLEVASGGQAVNTLNRPMIQAGRYSEIGTDWVNRYAAVSDRTKIETRASSEASVNLRPRWDDATSLAARKRMAADPTDRGKRNAFMEFESYLCEWELNPEWDFQAGTDQEGRSRLPAPRAVMPRLLSFMGSEQAPRDYAARGYSIRIEYKDGSDWISGPELDALDVLDDGGIRLPVLRDNTLSWKWTAGQFDVGSDGGVKITERPIRLTLAIPCDHRMLAMAVVPWNMLQYNNVQVVNVADIARVDLELDRVGFKNLRGLYREWRRKDSWPVPESFFAGNVKADDKLTAADPLVSDMAMMQAHIFHALEEAARIRKGGNLVIPKRLVTSWLLGYQVDQFQHVGGDLDGKTWFAFMAIGGLLWSNEPGNTRTEIFPA